MKLRSYLMKSVLVITLLLSPVLTGCPAAWLAGAAVAGAGIYAYSTGEHSQKHPADFETTWQAIMLALEDMEFSVDSTLKDAMSGNIKCHRADKTPITIEIEYDSPEVTMIGVRVGFSGDRRLSEIIQGKIGKKINELK